MPEQNKNPLTDKLIGNGHEALVREEDYFDVYPYFNQKKFRKTFAEQITTISGVSMIYINQVEDAMPKIGAVNQEKAEKKRRKLSTALKGCDNSGRMVAHINQKEKQVDRLKKDIKRLSREIDSAERDVEKNRFQIQLRKAEGEFKTADVKLQDLKNELAELAKNDSLEE